MDQVIANFVDATSDGLPDTYYVRITNNAASEYGLVITLDAAFDSEVNDNIPGDFNLDGVVDISDLGILASNYGKTSGMTWADGDANEDGAVDVCDLGVLAIYFNADSNTTMTSLADETDLSVKQGESTSLTDDETSAEEQRFTRLAAHDAAMNSLYSNPLQSRRSLNKFALAHEAEQLSVKQHRVKFTSQNKVVGDVFCHWRR